MAVVEVQGDGVLQVVEQQGVLGAMRQNLTDVYAVGKQQHWLRACGGKKGRYGEELWKIQWKRAQSVAGYEVKGDPDYRGQS